MPIRGKLKNINDISDINLSLFQKPIIGVDEVGRGCIAGPVAAAAVVFKSETDIELYHDSKSIPEKRRRELSESIRRHHEVSIGWATVEEVDSLNILQATFLAMQRAIAGLPYKSGTLLIDGRDKIPNLGAYEQLPIIKGDQKLRLISAASLVAKVARDQFMIELAEKYRQYGFEKHKGYGTAEHRLQIQKFGPCSWHRKSFGGVKEYI